MGTLDYIRWIGITNMWHIILFSNPF